MGLWQEVKRAFGLELPEREQKALGVIPTGAEGRPQYPSWSYESAAREGYMRDELVYACIEMLSTSAAQPPFCAYIGDKKITEHPVLDLLNHPNPHMDKFDLVAGMVTYRQVGGNWYLHSERSLAKKIVELWPLRPDRVRVIAGTGGKFIGGYQYSIGTFQEVLRPEDVIHGKTRHLLDDFHGLAPLAPIAGRVDLDAWTRDFMRAFFSNAGVPAGMLTVQKNLDDAEKDMIRSRFREQFAGPGGWHNLLIMEATEAKYQEMGLPLGERGAGIAGLDEINEARICMALGPIPPSLVSTRIGMGSSSYANRKSDRELFWEDVVIPLLAEIASVLTRGLAAEFGVDRVAFDLSDVVALKEDESARWDRVLNAFRTGVFTLEETRIDLGKDPKIKTGEVLYVPSSLIPTDPTLLLEPPDVPGDDLTDPTNPNDPNADPNAVDEGKVWRRNGKHVHA